MWSSSRVLRSIGLVVALGAPLALSACSGFTPVYGDHGVTAQRVALIYDKPNSRIEQIIYNDLALKLGKADGPAPKLSISASAGAVALTSQVVTAPVQPYKMVATAYITLTDVNGKVLFSGSRSASADYTGNSQVLNNQQAADDASNRAAKLLADTIRLTVLGALVK